VAKADSRKGPENQNDPTRFPKRRIISVAPGQIRRTCTQKQFTLPHSLTVYLVGQILSVEAAKSERKQAAVNRTGRRIPHSPTPSTFQPTQKRSEPHRLDSRLRSPAGPGARLSPSHPIRFLFLFLCYINLPSPSVLIPNPRPLRRRRSPVSHPSTTTRPRP
jgi:hypothetical protein